MLQSKRYYKYETLMRYAKLLGFGDVYEKMDPASGLHAIIAIHSTKRGPAIGGCRFYEYGASGAALKDVLQLSYIMTLKAAISDLPHGGAKAVILKSPEIKDREALFRAFGDLVHEMNGRYITAIDVGTSTKDMNTIATRTPFVIGATDFDASTDPSLYTARGVVRSIEAAVKFTKDKDSLEGLHIAIQGVGNVGYYLTEILYNHGAKITVCDSDPKAVQRCINDFKVTAVEVNEIYEVPCDIFSPCALGGIINPDTMKQFQCGIIAGSANNQLSHQKVSSLLKKRGILYVPDYLANSGGLINAAMAYDFQDLSIGDAQIATLYDTTLSLLERAKSESKTTTDIAYQIAKEKLDRPNLSKNIVASG